MCGKHNQWQLENLGNLKPKTERIKAEIIPVNIDNLIVIIGPAGSGKSRVFSKIQRGEANGLFPEVGNDELAGAKLCFGKKLFDESNVLSPIPVVVLHQASGRTGKVEENSKERLNEFLKISRSFHFVIVWAPLEVLSKRNAIRIWKCLVQIITFGKFGKIDDRSEGGVLKRVRLLLKFISKARMKKYRKRRVTDTYWSWVKYLEDIDYQSMYIVDSSGNSDAKFIPYTSDYFTRLTGSEKPVPK